VDLLTYEQVAKELESALEPRDPAPYLRRANIILARLAGSSAFDLGRDRSLRRSLERAERQTQARPTTGRPMTRRA
jgi:hypothetical protein